ncbi:hypothetical protein DM860_011395 [Cuscuta australis]|uniref:Uncharacterized protein n=1 Tax=Cuscuta australis TaxID=267555 RepID=A0A328DRD1_9ASTE|nr:hypothetical protein DM860_011395 [Cuscuta australis]
MPATSSGGASGHPPSSTPSSSHPNSSSQSLHGKSSAPRLPPPWKIFSPTTSGSPFSSKNRPLQRSVDKYKGLPCISFSKEEIENLATKFSKALVGTLFFNRPSVDFIRTTLERMGFIGFSVTLIDSTHILLNFSSDDDFHCCFKRREWSLGAYKMLISKLTPNFDPNVESPIMPIWISIKNLPIHFHAKESLMQIARIFGNPIKLDSTTENFGRPSIARICVEVDISQPQTNKFFILNGEQPMLLKAFYEEVPLFCPDCKGISRHKESCKHFKHADSQTKTQARFLDRNIPKGSGKDPVKKQYQQKTDKSSDPGTSLSQTSQTLQDKNHHSLPTTTNPLQDPQ